LLIRSFAIEHLNKQDNPILIMKYALVTGGSRGIGRAICLRLAEDGLVVIINYLSNRAAAEETLHLIQEQGGRGELLPFDVSDSNAITTALDDWSNRHGEDEYISILVNNAGIRHDNLMIFMEDRQWNDVLNTTLNGFFYTTRYLLKNMITHRCGRIVNVASLSGIKGLPGQTNYSAAKAALIGATKALAQEVAPRKITVNAVAPGFIETDMTKDLDEASMKKMIPTGRFGKPEEVADLVGFLASGKASYINGEVISINGGLYT
jgi:3-oxoacyl-[acyl-carrier protein] reductase